MLCYNQVWLSLAFWEPTVYQSARDTLAFLKGSERLVIAAVFPPLWPLFWRKHNLFWPVAESKLCWVMCVCKCRVKRYGCLSHILFVDSEENTLAPVFHSFSAYCWHFSVACFNDGWCCWFSRCTPKHICLYYKKKAIYFWNGEENSKLTLTEMPKAERGPHRHLFFFFLPAQISPIHGVKLCQHRQTIGSSSADVGKFHLIYPGLYQLSHSAFIFCGKKARTKSKAPQWKSRYCQQLVMDSARDRWEENEKKQQFQYTPGTYWKCITRVLHLHFFNSKAQRLSDRSIDG